MKPLAERDPALALKCAQFEEALAASFDRSLGIRSAGSTSASQGRRRKGSQQKGKGKEKEIIELDGDEVVRLKSTAAEGDGDEALELDADEYEEDPKALAAEEQRLDKAGAKILGEFARGATLKQPLPLSLVTKLLYRSWQKDGTIPPTYLPPPPSSPPPTSSPHPTISAIKTFASSAVEGFSTLRTRSQRALSLGSGVWARSPSAARGAGSGRSDSRGSGTAPARGREEQKRDLEEPSPSPSPLLLPPGAVASASQLNELPQKDTKEPAPGHELASTRPPGVEQSVQDKGPEPLVLEGKRKEDSALVSSSSSSEDEAVDVPAAVANLVISSADTVPELGEGTGGGAGAGAGGSTSGRSPGGSSTMKVEERLAESGWREEKEVDSGSDVI